jgi:acetyl-CoA synthetase
MHISYNELHQRVLQMANVLREKGLLKVIAFVFITRFRCLVSMLAAVEFGAIHSVVFGFSAAVATRILDGECKW